MNKIANSSLSCTNFRQLVASIVSALTVVISAAGFSFGQQAGSENEKKLTKNTRQLIFDGKRSGEGYYGSDGSQMVFQSERDPSNPFFQIYLIDFEFGDVTPVSPGHGKTTCAWIHPKQTNVVLFSSTHDDPEAKAKQRAEIEFRESGQSRRYSWDYDENYEIYTFDTLTKKYNRLTESVGYDAEGSFSPDGKLIAFASNRNAYSRPMSEEDKKQFELDPAYMMDIFIMNSDGSALKQLTTTAGYDGGPFFSPDGKRICWRRFAPNGATAEIMTMNTDGSDQKQLTRFNKMSWAPFYHPSGKYLIFTTNKHGFSNFELYLVDKDGKSTPVRVTNTKGFDGLASFSPDGNKLTWTTNRNEKKQSQVYLADWDHELAMKMLKLDAASKEETIASAEGSKTAAQTDPDFTAADVGRHVDYLCRKELGGRMTGSVGERQATAYAAAYMDSLGFQPGGDDGTWYQPFDFPAGAELGPNNLLTLDNQNYTAEKDFTPLTFSGNGSFDSTSVVFVGYGIDAEKTDDQPAYNSYKDIDVTGKWAMMFRYMPDDVDEGRRTFLAAQSSLRRKTMIARDKGAVGVIIVSGPKSNVKQQLVPLTSDFSSAGTSTAAISITDDLAVDWINKAGKNLGQIQAQLDSGNEVTGFELPGKLTATVEVIQKRGTGRNVLGRMIAGDKPSSHAIIIGAHIDHLGTGTTGSLAKNDEKGQIHVGADDNASGVAAMLEIAEYLAGLKKRGKLNMQRDIIFAGWSGEELGLFGSKHYVSVVIPNGANQSITKLTPYAGDPHDLNALSQYYQDCLNAFDSTNYTESDQKQIQSNADGMKVVVNLLSSAAANQNGRHDASIATYKKLIELSDKVLAASKPQNKEQKEGQGSGPIVACLNMDMVGRMRDIVSIKGVGSSSHWNSMIEKANVVVGLPVEAIDDTNLPTDASSFYQAGVPILSAFTGSHNDYHTPRDTPEKLNYPDAARIARLMALIARQLVINEEVPNYIRQVESQKKRIAAGGRRARLGTVPNYTEKVTGVLLDDVEVDGPAAQAGLKGGDVIVELASKKIENIYDYQYAIDILKVGKETPIAIVRDGKRVDLTIVPGSRD